MEEIDIVPDNLPILINRLFTCVLLSVVLFACQNMPDERQEWVKFEHQKY